MRALRGGACEGHTHFLELALLVEPVHMGQQAAPVCSLQLEDADQRLHETGGTLSQDPESTCLQLLQPRAALEAPRPGLSGDGILWPWAWCRAGEVQRLGDSGEGDGWLSGLRTKPTGRGATATQLPPYGPPSGCGGPTSWARSPRG